MSDFKKIQDFRKSKTSKYQYQDPTYLSFLLMFDFTDKVNSPFLANEGKAHAFLKKLVDANPDYQKRLDSYLDFKKALKTINTEMPWYWQSISGLDRILKFNPLNSYYGGDDARLEIATLESLNLPIAGLMQLYRNACFDENKWQWILPQNLREFRMYAYVTEIRSIQNLGSPGNQQGEEIVNKNSEISGEAGRPYFMFGLKGCQFDMQGGSDPFATLTKAAPDMAANTIAITYDTVVNINARVLNGIITNQTSDEIAPAPQSETSGDTNNISKIGQKIKDLKDRAINDLKTRGENRVKEIKTQAKDATIGRANRAAENIYRDFIEGIDDAFDPAKQFKNIKAAIGENVHKDLLGNDPKEVTAAKILNKAAQDALGNVYE